MTYSFNFIGANIAFFRCLRAAVPPTTQHQPTTAYLILEEYIKFWTSESAKLSLTELLHDSYASKMHPELGCTGDSRYIGTATVFVSYVWSYSIHELCDALEQFLAQDQKQFPAESTYFWLDFLCIPQNIKVTLPPDYLANVFGTSIKKIGHTLVVLLPWDKPGVLYRAWCIYEMFLSLSTDTPLSVTWSSSQNRALQNVIRKRPKDALDFINQVDVTNADAREAADKKLILDAVESVPGGSGYVNRRVRGLLFKEYLEKFLAPEGLYVFAYQQFRSLTGPEVTTHDFFKAFIKPTIESAGCSLIDILREHHSDNSPHPTLGLTYSQVTNGRAPNIFTSQTWYSNFHQLCNAMDNFFRVHPGLDPTQVTWFSDMASMALTHDKLIEAGVPPEDARQVQIDNYARKVLSTERFVSILQPWEKPLSLTRVWVLFEIFTAREAKMPFEMLTSVCEEERFLKAAMADFPSVERAIDECRAVFRTFDAGGRSSRFHDGESTDVECFKAMFSAAPGGLDSLALFVAQRYVEWMCSTLGRAIFQEKRQSLFGSSGFSSAPAMTLTLQQQRSVPLMETRLEALRTMQEKLGPSAAPRPAPTQPESQTLKRSRVEE